MSDSYAQQHMRGAPVMDASELTAFYEGRMPSSVPRLNTNSHQISHDGLSEYPSSIKQQLSQSLHGPGIGGNGAKAGSDPNHTAVAQLRGTRGSNIIVKNPLIGDGEFEEGTGRERKRRDNINEKIQDLLALIPSSYFKAKEDVSGSSVKSEKIGLEEAVLAALRNSGTKDGKPNKGQILTKLVIYLQDMQNLIDEQNRKEMELRTRLLTLKLRTSGGAMSSATNVGHTTAEQVLGEIGVGPLCQEYFTRILAESRPEL